MVYDRHKPRDRDPSPRDLIDEDRSEQEFSEHDADPDDDRIATVVPVDPPTGVERVERERDELKDRLLRTIAEFDNYRKRIDRERREREAGAAMDLLQEILPLVDDFERALEYEAGAGPDPLRAGIELIYKQLQDLLRKRGVVPIEAVGQDFDPHVHQAVEHVASAEHRDGEVIDEVRKGYLIGERLLRPAMVRVAKA